MIKKLALLKFKGAFAVARADKWNRDSVSRTMWHCLSCALIFIVLILRMVLEHQKFVDGGSFKRLQGW